MSFCLSKKNISTEISILILRSIILIFHSCLLNAQKQVENLDRGIIAIRTGENEVFISWRRFGNENQRIRYNLYRGGILLNSTPLKESNFIDKTPNNGYYAVNSVIGNQEYPGFGNASVWENSFYTLNINRPPSNVTPDDVSYSYRPNDCSAGDYEMIVKWDPSNSKDNAHAGHTGNVYLDAYNMEGHQLWRIDLGRNIRAGAHYTQMIVYDLDGDGKAEIACKTADATVDGAGNVIGDKNADYRNKDGYVLAGPEYLTIFDGETGAALSTTDYIPQRGNVSALGDNYGNRVDRFLAGIVYYLDGQNPSLIMCRGDYTRTVIAAWDWIGSELTMKWVFDSDENNQNAYAGQGAHSLTIGDVDNDGKDEITYGACAIDDNRAGSMTIHRSTNSDLSDPKELSIVDPLSTLYKDIAVEKSKDYYYWITGTDEDGNPVESNVIDGKLSIINSLKTDQSNISYSIVPNPFSDSFVVKTDNETIEYSIINTQGRIIEEGTISGSEQQIGRKLPAGFYLIRFTQNNSLIVR